MSSSEIAISIEGIGKSYEIYNSPSDRLKQFFLPMLARLVGRKPKSYYSQFSALKDISFNVKRGETLGIIGRNGSGKSTLLQIICGTLAPTNGNVRVSGRVAALLELGSGFNPEFTGRENVYLNASILGLTKEETDLRFDDIARFADIGLFIEQPVKTYSSGMMLRLAFAVIAHVDADILIIDEALSVGDAFFTQKCMRFIREFMDRGTLLFVSHDIGSVINLCEKALWLDSGNQIFLGDAKPTSEKYLEYSLKDSYGPEIKVQSIERNLSEELLSVQDLAKSAIYDAASNVGSEERIEIVGNINSSGGWKTGAGEILAAELIAVDGSSPANWEGGEMVELTLNAVAYQDFSQPILGFLVRDRLGQDLFGENTLPFTDLNQLSIAAGERFRASFKFKLPMLPNGQYVVMASLANGDFINHIQHHWMHDALLINVYSSKVRWGLVGLSFECIDMRPLP